MKIGRNQKLIFIGDSITDAARTKPVGEGLWDAYGKGYVSQVESLLTSTYPELSIRVVNQGLSGNTVRDLQTRWRQDVLDLRPDWLSIMIGINDAWRLFDMPLQSELHVPPDEYEERLEELVASTRPKLKGMILMSPYVIEPNRAEPMRALMDRYGGIVQRIARSHDALFVDVQAAFDAVLAHRHPMSLAWDRIHPGAAGHMVITRAFLQAIGYEWRHSVADSL